MTMDFNQPLLEHCPFCDYALEGFPEKHVCPECGQPFDRRWAVFGGKAGWRAMSMGHRIGVFVCGVLALVVGVGWVADGFKVFGLVCVLPFVTMAFLEVLPAFRGGRRFVAVGPDGVALGDRPSRELREMAWAHVEKVDRDWSNRIRVHLKDEVISWSLGHGFDSNARQCEKYINRYFELPE